MRSACTTLSIGFALILSAGHVGAAELRVLSLGSVQIAAKALPRTYVYFMHEDEAMGTRFAQRLNELWRELPGAGSQ